MAKLVRLIKPVTDAILAVMKHVRETTGEEPTQEEIADALKSYFIMNEIGNQIKFRRKKQASTEPAETGPRDMFWTFNLMKGPSKNSLIKVGLFYRNLHEAITTVRRFVKDATGEEPSAVEISQSLMSTFIMSEIKNQIDWQRNGQDKSKKPLSLTK